MQWKQMTDLALVEACLAGQQEGFAELMARYKNLVFSIILRMTHNKEEVEDLAQEVFIKMYKNLARYSPDFKFSTWVMRITSNHVIDFHRKRKHDTVSLDAAENLASTSEESPEAALLAQEQAARVQKIVADLPDMYKIPIVLFHQKGMSYQDIAQKINEPLSKVKNRIFRGRKLLKERYLQLGEESP